MEVFVTKIGGFQLLVIVTGNLVLDAAKWNLFHLKKNNTVCSSSKWLQKKQVVAKKKGGEGARPS